MKLSEAIQIGAKKRPQLKGELFGYEEGVIKSSAFGSMIEALVEEAGHSTEKLIEEFLKHDYERNLSDFPEIKNLGEDYPVFRRSLVCEREGCPEMGEENHVFYPFHLFLLHLNNKHGLTREDIADIVKAMEEHPILPVGSKV